MDEKTTVGENTVTVLQSTPMCSHCKIRPGNASLGTYRLYCDHCWDEINVRKSQTMIAKGMKRSNETRAAMAASKKANKKENHKTWKLYRDYFLDQLNREDELARVIKLKEAKTVSNQEVDGL